MFLYAGLDWSGTPHAKEKGVEKDLYIPCGVRVPDVEATNGYFAGWRAEFGRPATFEFHGYECGPRTLLRAADYVLEVGQVTAVVFDKDVLVDEMGPEVFEKPALLPPATGRVVLDRMLSTSPLRRVWCDEDMPNKKRQQAFNTAVKRKARTLWPDDASPDMKHYPSNKSNLVQLADMIAYVLQREARGLLETAELRQRAQALWRKQGNQVWWGKKNDLRPYL